MTTAGQSLPAELLARICEVVDPFDAAWQAVAEGATPPRIEEALRDIPEADQPAFLRELLAVELECRLRFGDQPNAAEYLARFPQHETLVRSVVEEVQRDHPVKALQTTVAESALGKGETPGTGANRSLFIPPRGMSLPPQFGDYELLAEVARGGMGVVYKARQRSLNRIVVVKMILAGASANPETVQRFHREAEAAAHLIHPHIVQTFEVGEHDGQHFFSMEYVDGPSLSALNRDHPLLARQAAEVVRTLAAAVQFAHSRGVIHRDLKPQNVLMSVGQAFQPDPKGKTPTTRTSPSERVRLESLTYDPKITDFGLAKRLDTDSGQTKTGEIMGTPSYMAPEQAAGKTKSIGPPADIYALGAILYELLTGRPPFRANTPLDTLLQVLEQEPVSARLLNPDTDRDLDTICTKCLQKEPQKRYATAQDLANELTRYLNGESIHARPVSKSEQVWRWCCRNPVVASLSVAVLLILLGGIFVSSFFALQSAARNRALQTETTRANKKALEASENATRANAKTNEALANAKKAQIEKDRADAKADEARRHLYSAHMNLAQRNWEIPQVGLVLNSLESTRPQPGETDIRGFEWYYRDRLCHSFLLDLKGHTGGVTSVAFSADGKRLASASVDGTVKVWNVTSAQETLTLNGHTGGVQSVAFSPDGKRLALASGDQTVKVWDATSGQETLTFKGHTGSVQSVAFSPDGKRLASASGDQTVKVWDATSGAESLTLKGHTSTVSSVAFGPDGKRLASASYDGTVKVWDAASGQETLTFKEHAAPVKSVAFSPDGKRLASCGGEYEKPGEVKVWDATSGELSLTLKGHTLEVNSVAFSPDGKRLASASKDQTVKVWDATSGPLSLTLKGHIGSVYSVTFSPDGKRLASASLDSTLKVWDATSGPLSLTLKGHAARVNSVAFSPDGTRLASASDDLTVKVWDERSGQEMLTLKGHTGGVTSVAFSADGKRLASASVDGTVKVWDAASGHETLTLRGHTAAVKSVVYNPDGNRLASASDDHTVKLWDATSGQETLTLRGHTAAVKCVVFNPDGNRLASASADGTVKVYDARSGQDALTVNGQNSSVWSVAFSPDGKRLASASHDETVKVWDAKSGELLLRCKGHSNAVTSVVFSLDGKRLASASFDRTVNVWNATSGELLLTLQGNIGRVQSVAFSPDGKRLASVSAEFFKPGEVNVWDARPWTPELRAEREALSLIHFLRDQAQPQSEWLNAIAADQTISEPVRQRARQFAREWKNE